jgi:hypothetical protein
MMDRKKNKLIDMKEADVIQMLNRLGKQKRAAESLNVAETTLGLWLKAKGIRPVTRWEKTAETDKGA